MNARAHGAVLARGTIREAPEDFRVEERLGFEPDGAGEHLLVLVEKRGANTHWVARALAELACAKRVDVGYAGSKDRHAVARQWFSVRVGGRPDPDWDRLEVPGVRVLAAARHGRKLRHGAHAANAFELRVRRFEGERAAFEDRLRAVATQGVPNYFGPQRYGHDNLSRARDLFAGARVPRVQRGYALSAARSRIFDALLAARVGARNWNCLLPGDVANLAGSASWFVVDAIDGTLEGRVRAHDLHPTGPLWGRGDPPARGAVLDLERAVAAEHADLARGLEAAGLEHARRPLRLTPARLRWEIGRDDAVLAFELPPGAYATTVLHELIDFEDRGGSGAADHEAC